MHFSKTPEKMDLSCCRVYILEHSIGEVCSGGGGANGTLEFPFPSQLMEGRTLRGSELCCEAKQKHNNIH